MMDLLHTIAEQSQLLNRIAADKGFNAAVERCVHELITCYEKRGGKLLIAGNGGSAAEAQHMAAEIVCQFQLSRRGQPAIALTVDSSIITAWANDHSYDQVFARQVEALARPGDVLLLLSTSGNSTNLVEAAKAAVAKEVTVCGLLGKGGGRLLNYCDISMVVPSDCTPRVQEVHLLIVHHLCEKLDALFFEMGS